MKYHDLSLQRRVDIENELLALMKDVPFDAITVKDLTDRLGIARKTFYHYFSNKHVCLESLMDRLIYECNLNLLQDIPPDAARSLFYENQLQFWMAHREFLEAVNDNKLGLLFVERFLRYILQNEPTLMKRLQTALVPCDEDILFFYLSGEIALLLRWCKGGFALPMEEMVAKLQRLIHEPLLAPFQP